MGGLRWGAMLVALAFACPASARERSDLVVLVNGNNISGEIMGLSRGKLDYKTDDAGRLSIEWLKVRRVTSRFSYEIETGDGQRHYSSLRAAPGDGDGKVLLDDGTVLPVRDVVAIVPLDAGLLSRISAYFDLGLAVAKANRAVTLNSDGMIAYRGERVGTTISFDLYVQDSENVATATNFTGKVSGDLYFGRWTTQLGVGVEENSELDLNLRLTLAAGAGYAAVQTNEMLLLAKLGLAGIREVYTTGDPTWYLTSLVGGAWDVFRYDSPKLDVGISVDVYPYLTDLGRVRVEGTIRVKYEVLKDFHVGLNFTDTFDSRPPEASSQNDYNVAFTVGWSYRR